MKTQSGTFTAQDKTSIYWKGWVPDNSPKAVVHVIHGYAEHIDRYGNVVNELAARRVCRFRHRPPRAWPQRWASADTSRAFRNSSMMKSSSP